MGGWSLGDMGYLVHSRKQMMGEKVINFWYPIPVMVISAENNLALVVDGHDRYRINMATGIIVNVEELISTQAAAQAKANKLNAEDR